MTPSCDDLSRELLDAALDPETATDPWPLFESWYQTATDNNAPRPDAMTLATVGENGRPSARVVLYKGHGDGAIVFFTNYESRKARELAHQPWAALVFHWPLLERQIRLEGHVEKTSRAESEAYFATRPRESQLGAWASPQSRAIGSRAELERAVEMLERQYGRGEIPCPPHWGGYRLKATQIEFWQGGSGRLHDRWLYVRSDGVWVKTRLGP